MQIPRRKIFLPVAHQKSGSIPVKDTLIYELTTQLNVLD
jgi:hypothetical protein